MRSGDHAPGMPNGVNFGSFSNLHVLNSIGQFADLFGLSNGKHGIWATDHNGILQYVACEGDLLEVAPGDYRTIQSIYFNYLSETGNAEGRATPFNNLGQVAFTASFTDGSSGVFVSNAVALLPGDINLDHDVNAADISAMMAALANLSDYQSMNNLTAQQLLQIADLTGDSKVTNVDLQRLLVDLANSAGTGGGSLTAVPEPASIALLAAGALILMASRAKTHLSRAT
jgi:hypothetical protein